MEFKHEIIETNHQFPFKIFEFQSQNPDRIIPKHWHESVEFLFCLSGKLNVWLNSEHFILKKRDLLLINSNIIHATQSPVANHVLVIQIPLQMVNEITEGGYKEHYLFRLNSLEDQDEATKSIQNLFEEIVYIYICPSTANRILLKSHLFKIFSLLLLHKSFSTEKYQKIHSDKYLERLGEITEFVKQHYKENLTLESISDHFNYSAAYFSRFFKKYMGINFSEYVISIRMDQAYRLLLNTDHSLWEIALETGFKNPRTFYNHFEKVYHMAPSIYRKKYT